MNIALGFVKIIDIIEHTVRIRIPSLHGPNKITDYPSSVSNEKRNALWTLDKNLPFASVMFPLGTNLEDLVWTNTEVTSGDVKLIQKDEVVYVLFPESNNNDNPIIIGTTGLFYKE